VSAATAGYVGVPGHGRPAREYVIFRCGEECRAGESGDKFSFIEV